MYEKILVPLDGSQLAEVALPYAEELAGRIGSEVTLLFVHESIDDPNQYLRQVYIQKIVESTKRAAEIYSGILDAQSATHVNSVSLFGYPAEKIVEYADKENIGLIIMSTHGQSGIKRWPLGSVADKIVKATTRPVVLIRAKGAQPDNIRKQGIFKKALVPLDGSKEGEVVLPYVEALASKLKVKVILVQVLAASCPGYTAEGYDNLAYTEQELQSNKEIALEYLNNVGNRLKKKGITVVSEVKFGAAPEEIISYAAETRADVVAMSTHGRSGIGHWILGSVAERVLNEGNTPLLLVREV